jgi:hypothetical protein
VATNGVGRSHETLLPQDIAILSPEGMFVDRFIFEENYFASLSRRLQRGSVQPSRISAFVEYTSARSIPKIQKGG